jgi:hypothetical protein
MRRCLRELSPGSAHGRLRQSVPGLCGGVPRDDPARSALIPEQEHIKQAARFALAMTKMTFACEVEDVLDTVMASWPSLV